MRSTRPIEHPPTGAPLFKDRTVPKLLHIPRTGGHARAASLFGMNRKGRVALAPHNTRAKDCKGPVICFLRDPVTWFLSAARRLKIDPQELLNQRQHSKATQYGAKELLTRTQSWWVEDVPSDVELELYKMECLDEVWPILVKKYDWDINPLPPVGHPDRNESPGGLPEISEGLEIDICNEYSDDLALWEGC